MIGVKDFSIPPLTMQLIAEIAVRYGTLNRDGGEVVTMVCFSVTFHRSSGRNPVSLFTSFFFPHIPTPR